MLWFRRQIPFELQNYEWNILDERKHQKEGGVFDKIAFIGTGKMAQAVIEPLINTGVQPANQIAVFDVNYNLMKEMPER